MVRIFSILLVCVGEIMAGRLNRFIRHYEPVWFDLPPAQRAQSRPKRSVDTDSSSIRFSAMSRDFHLILWRDTSIFAKNFIAVIDDVRIDLDVSHIHSGMVSGYAQSRVFGATIRGTFEGHISTGDGSEYYVEPGSRFFGLDVNYSVIYSTEDVEMPSDLASAPGCGVDVLYSRNILTSNQRRHHELRRKKRDLDYIPFPGKALNDSRRKTGRAVTKASPSRRLCNVEINVDHTLYQAYRARTGDDASARERIAASVASHVDVASRVYSTTDFEGITGIKFAVQILKINTTKSCQGNRQATNPYCSDALDVNVMLDILSHTDHDDFCLAFVWSFREYSHRTLGLAYVGNPDDRPGGVCDKFRTIQFALGTRKAGLNAVVMTFLNEGSAVPARTSQITFLHEIGHAFGSIHDSDPVCAPGDPPGNFIMYREATSGTRDNNWKFSPCSVKSISAVLDSVLHEYHGKDNCFLEIEGPFCGNNIREDEEECDCGYTEGDCDDSCCYPNRNQDMSKGCTLRPKAACSPTAGSCCTSACTFLDQSHTCSPEDECNYASTCNTVSAQCPPMQPKQNFTACNKDTQVCLEGQCDGSICNKYGYDDCQPYGNGYSAEQMCQIYCRPFNSTGPCLDPCKLPPLVSLCGRRKEPGAACNDYTGYCDVFRICRDIDEEGPLTRLEGLLFGRASKVRDWMQNHVWAVVSLGIGSLLGMALFIRCCAVLTPSSNPSLRRARTFKEGVKHPADVLLYG